MKGSCEPPRHTPRMERFCIWVCGGGYGGVGLKGKGTLAKRDGRGGGVAGGGRRSGGVEMVGLKGGWGRGWGATQPLPLSPLLTQAHPTKNPRLSCNVCCEAQIVLLGLAILSSGHYGWR